MNRREFLKLASGGGRHDCRRRPGSRSPGAHRPSSRPNGCGLLMTSGVQAGDVTARTRDDLEPHRSAGADDRGVRRQRRVPRRDDDRRVPRRSKTPTSRRASTSAASGRARWCSTACASTAWPIRARGASRVTGQFRTAPRERRRIKLAWSADTVGQGWGIRPEHRRPAHLRDDAASRAGRLRALGRHDLRRQPAAAGGAAGRRARVEEPRHARRSRRWPRRWTSSAATTPTTCSTSTCADSTRPCPCSRSGTTTR